MATTPVSTVWKTEPMPTSLTLDDHLAVIAAAGHRLAVESMAAGLDARVPTCPAWDVRALVAHQAMVHRWSTAQVLGEDASALPTQTELREHPSLMTHYEEGLARLLDALRAAPADLKAMTFLNDAPAPREFWARRQAHETSMHAVDALSARLGRYPTTADAAIETSLAVDGLDELLRGFFTRGKSKLFDGSDYSFVVAPVDADRHWVVEVAERLTVAPGDHAPTDAAVATLRGSAAALYLALWNRGDDIEVDGDGTVADRWHATQRVTW